MNVLTKVTIMADSANVAPIQVLVDEQVVASIAPGTEALVPLGVIRRELGDKYWVWSVVNGAWIPQGTAYLKYIRETA